MPNVHNAGAEKVHMEMILGHSLYGMDVHYLVPTEESLRKAMERYMERQDGGACGGLR